MGDAAREWGSVAAAWDRNIEEVDVHHASATQALLAALDVRPGDRVLELGCGPGSLGPVWSDLVGPTGRVTLSDVAPEMVAVAARRNAGLAAVDTAVLDAAAIDRHDGAFDVVACRMGLMFVTEPAEAFSEVHRVLADGGRFGGMTWGAMEDNPWVTCVGMAAMLQGITTGGPPVGPGAMFSLADPGRLEALAKSARFEDIRVEAHPVVFTAPSVEAHVERITSMAGPIAGAIAGATPAQREALLGTARELLAPHVTDEGVEVPGRALLVTGRR